MIAHTEAGAPAGSVPAHAAEQLLNVKLADASGSRLLSRPEFCSMVNASTSTGERWARTGYGPRPVKIGPRRVGYRLADVLAFIAERQQAA